MTTINPENPRDQFIQQQTTWTDEEKKMLSTYEAYINSQSEEKKSQVAEKLKDAAPSVVLKFSTASQPFKNFCEKELIHQKEWSAKLQQLGCIGNSVGSVDGVEQCTTYKQYVGLYLYRQFEKFQEANEEIALFFLNKSCELGFFHALVKRCEINQALLKKQPDTKLITQLKEDLQHFGNLYWSLGYMRASRVCLDIGNTYLNENKPELEEVAKQFHEAAAEFFYCAMFLAEWPMSHSLVDTLYHKERITEVFGLEDGVDAEYFLTKCIDKTVDKLHRDALREKVRNMMIKALVIALNQKTQV